MTDWSSVEFANTTAKSRKAQDYLPILADLLSVWDFFACLFAGQAALMLYGRYVVQEAGDFAASGSCWRDIVFGSLIAALTLRDAAAILNRKLKPTSQFVMLAERRSCVAFAVLIAVGMATRATDDLARMWLLTWFLLFAILVAASRFAVSSYLHRLQAHGHFRESIAIVGAPGFRERLAARLAREANVIGTFDAYCPNGPVREDDPDDLAGLLELGRDGQVDAVILALEHGDAAEADHIVQRLKALPIQVAICADEGWENPVSPTMRLLGGLPMAVVADRPIKRWDLLSKLVLDKLGALLLLVLLSPLILAVAVAVGLDSPGPIIFRQTRQGWCGREFTVFKFRTMQAANSGLQRQFQTLRQDPRFTRVGRRLRQLSLDELPQLWNVLRGDMSLVGPRPHADSLHDVDRAGHEVVAEYAQRNRMKPGITGWAQVHGARGATATLDQLRHRVEFDLFYIENWSFWLDIQILLRTPFAMAGENAF